MNGIISNCTEKSDESIQSDDCDTSKILVNYERFGISSYDQQFQCQNDSHDCCCKCIHEYIQNKINQFKYNEQF